MKLKLAALLAGVLLLAGVHSSGSLPASATSACSGCQITSTTLVVNGIDNYHQTNYFSGFSFWIGPAGPLGSGRAWLSVGATNYNSDHSVYVSVRSTTGAGAGSTLVIPLGKTAIVELGPWLNLANGTYTGVISESGADYTSGFVATLEELWQ